MTTANEAIALEYVAQGVLRIDDDGAIWRVGNKWSNGKQVKIQPCAPKRAESPDRYGYLMLVLRDQGRCIGVRAHRVIYAYFHGGQVDDDLEVNHPDLDRRNNRPDNLTLASHHGNILHAVINRSDFGSRRLSEGAVQEIRARRDKGESNASIASEYGITPENVSLIHRRKSWAWLPGAVGS